MDAAALEQRRRRNREAMQRARKREREEVEAMRRDIRVLERQYREALHQAAQSIHTSDDHALPPPPPSTVTAQPRTLQEREATLFAEYQRLARASKVLQQENFRLTKLLDQRRKAYERMERILADYHEQKVDVSDDLDGVHRHIRMAETVQSSTRIAYAPGKDFAGITEAEAAAFIMKCVHEIRQFELTRTPPVPTVSESFGWTLKQAVFHKSKIYWMLTKRAANVTASAAAEKAWAEYQSVDSNNVAKPMRVVRFETLQTVNDNTQVVVRDMVHPLHPGVVMRSMMVRFRMETDSGFVVGRANMFSSSDNDQEDSRVISSDPLVIRRADMSTWLEFEPLDPAHPERPGCLAKFAGYSDYGTTFDLSERLVTILLATLHVENRVLGSLTPLLAG
jgi:hypothetical protein